MIPFIITKVSSSVIFFFSQLSCGVCERRGACVGVRGQLWGLVPHPLWALWASRCWSQRQVCAASISALRATSRHPHLTHLFHCFETGSYTFPQDGLAVRSLD